MITTNEALDAAYEALARIDGARLRETDPEAADAVADALWRVACVAPAAKLKVVSEEVN